MVHYGSGEAGCRGREYKWWEGLVEKTVPLARARVGGALGLAEGEGGGGSGVRLRLLPFVLVSSY
jgi:hypothetical protein